MTILQLRYIWNDNGKLDSDHDVLEPQLVENMDECKYYICHTSGVTLEELSKMQVGVVMRELHESHEDLVIK